MAQHDRHQRRARAKAALGSLLFLAVAPGLVAGLLPWWLTGWHAAGSMALPVAAAGVVLVLVLVLVGVAVLLHAFARFVAEGLGTPAPVAPTSAPPRLSHHPASLVGGLYRHVRNPMYLAVATTIVGQAILLARPGLLLYAVAFGVGVGTFVHFYEEPTLRVGSARSTTRIAAPFRRGGHGGGRGHRARTTATSPTSRSRVLTLHGT